MANWLNLTKLKEWDYPFFLGFAYDAVTDEDIEAALTDVVNLPHVDVRLDWEDDRWLEQHTGIPASQKHAYRIAALVRAFREGDVMQRTIALDTFTVGTCCSCVPNGHHRIRALQYLGVHSGPFGLSGLVDVLEDLVRKAGSECPPDAAHYFSAELLAPAEDDVRLEDKATA